jgi:competence protein ComEA
MTSGVPTGKDGPVADVVEAAGFVLLAVLCMVGGLALAVNTAETFTSRVPFGVDDTINPNDASSVSLARLPGVGPSRARAIVSYRSRFGGQTGQGRIAFGRAEDLERVTGIGPATVEAIRPWLSFESRSAGRLDTVDPGP